MSSLTLFQKRHLSRDSLSNLAYPFDIWVRVFEFLDIKTCKTFFEVCKAFSTLGTKEFINKHAHKADSLFKYHLEDLTFDIKEYLSASYYNDLLTTLKHFHDVPKMAFYTKGVEFSLIRKLGEASKDELDKTIIDKLRAIAYNLKVTNDDIVYLLSVLDPDTIKAFLAYWSINPWLDVSLLLALSKGGYTIKSLYMFDSRVPFGDLISNCGILWTYSNITLSPNVPLEYIFDNHDLDWDWGMIRIKEGWTRDLMLKLIKLRKGCYDIFEMIPLEDVNPLDQSVNVEWLVDLPTISKSLCDIIPKGYLEAYLRWYYGLFEKDPERLHRLRWYDIASILAKRSFSNDELESLISFLLSTGNYMEGEPGYFWSALNKNPSLNYAFIKGFKVDLISKLKLRGLLFNPSFGFLDIKDVIHCKASMT